MVLVQLHNHVQKNEARPLPHTVHKNWIDSKWIKDQDVSSKTMKVLGENMEIELQNLRLWTPYSKYILKLKKLGKTTRSFRYDLNQISYDYTVKWQIDSRDEIDGVPEELWTEVHDIV